MDYCNTITMSGYTSRYLSPDIWNLVTSVGSLETETLCAAIGVGSVQTEGSWATTSTGTSLNIVLRGKSKSYIEIRFLIHEYNINEKICQSRCLWLQRLFKENRSTKIQLHRQTHTPIKYLALTLPPVITLTDPRGIVTAARVGTISTTQTELTVRVIVEARWALVTLITCVVRLTGALSSNQVTLSGLCCPWITVAKLEA